MTDERAKYLHDQPTNLTVDQKFRLVARLLREYFMPDRPVRVRRAPKNDPGLVKLNANGYTHLANSDKSKSEQYFVIVINKDMDWDKQLNAMMHEWAHAMTWDMPTSQDHPRDWAHAYGKIYRFIIED